MITMIVPFGVLVCAASLMGFTAVTFTGFSNYFYYVGVSLIATLGFVFANSKLDPLVYVVATNTIIGISALVVLCLRTHTYPSTNALIGIVLMVVGIYFSMK